MRSGVSNTTATESTARLDGGAAKVDGKRKADGEREGWIKGSFCVGSNPSNR